eukprot:IDg19957t1
MEFLFGKHEAQLSELFWGRIEQFLAARQHLLLENLSSSFMQRNADRYAQAVYGRSKALENCIVFINGKVICIARPGDHETQNAAYNGHKRKHALKYQAVTTPDGLILHVYSPLEGPRHNWTPYKQSAQRAFNLAISRVIVTVEWVLKEIKLYWTSVDYRRKMLVTESPVGAMYIAAMLLTNMRNCVHPN